MMSLVDYYWPVMVVALIIGIASGIVAFRPRRRRQDDKGMER